MAGLTSLLVELRQVEAELWDGLEAGSEGDKEIALPFIGWNNGPKPAVRCMISVGARD